MAEGDPQNKGRKTVRRRVIIGKNPEGKKIYGWRNFDADEPPALGEKPLTDESGNPLRTTTPRRPGYPQDPGETKPVEEVPMGGVPRDD